LKKPFKQWKADVASFASPIIEDKNESLSIPGGAGQPTNFDPVVATFIDCLEAQKVSIVARVKVILYTVIFYEMSQKISRGNITDATIKKIHDGLPQRYVSDTMTVGNTIKEWVAAGREFSRLANALGGLGSIFLLDLDLGWSVSQD
jgi:hypothetical protein